METTTGAIHPWVAAGARGARFAITTTAAPDWSATRDFAQAAEGLGFDALLLPDHPAVTPSATWTTLAALAGVTRSIRLGTLVSCVAYWNPVVLARLAADVDRLSGGRLVLGMGSGDMPHEFHQLGLPYPPVRQRQAALEEALQLLTPLLRGEPATLQGAHFSANEVVLQPPAVQQPHVPLLVAGGGERTTLRVAAQYADASNLGAASWAGRVFSSTDAQPKFDALRAHCAAAGRPYEAILRTALVGLFLSETPTTLEAKLAQVPPHLLAFFEQLPVVGTPEAAVERVRALLAVGFQYVVFIIMAFDLESLRLAAERVIPLVTEAGVTLSEVND